MSRSLYISLLGLIIWGTPLPQAATAGEKDANDLVLDDQMAYVQDAWITYDAFDRTIFNGRVEFKQPGTYRIVYGYRKDDKWMDGGLIGTKYFGEKVVTSGGGTLITYSFLLSGRPPLNRKWSMEVYPDE